MARRPTPYASGMSGKPFAAVAMLLIVCGAARARALEEAAAEARAWRRAAGWSDPDRADRTESLVK